MKCAVWFLILIYEVHSSQFFNISCNVNSSYDIDITVSYLTNSIVIVCNNNTLHTKSVENCVKNRRFISVLIVHCFVPNDIIDSTILYYAEGISMSDVYTDDKFVFANLVANTLMLKIHNVREIVFDNMPFLRSLIVRNPEWQISNSTFRNVPNLVTFWNSGNRVNIIEDSIFNLIPNLEILLLVNGSFNADRLEIFSGSNKLKILNIFGNGLTSLPTDIFANLHSLKKLFLHRNSLTDLSPKLLGHNRLLEIFEVSENPLQQLPEELFQNCSRLLSFSASSCKLSSIPEKLFSNCPLLMNVSLDDNFLTAIHPETFVKTILLQLQLSGNLLTSLPTGLFYPDNLLTHLNLSRNSFTQIPSSSFEKIFSMKVLDLRSNNIETIEEKDFAFLVNLEKLDLSHNKLRKFGTFGIFRYLNYINLSFNNIEEFPKLFWEPFNVAVIDLSYNNITHLSSSDLPSSGFINLQHNQIAYVTINKNISPNVSLQLNFNVFSCQCSLRDFVKNIQSRRISIVEADHLTCHDTMKDRKLVNINLLHICPYYERCPQSCFCYLHEDNTVLVNCTSANLRTFPVILPPKTSVVHMTNNSISDFQIPQTAEWQNITYLNLDNNNLNPWTNWIIPFGLEKLSLRYNKLEFIPESLLRHVTAATIFKLDIRNNSFTCNCSFRSFKYWFTDNIKKIAKSKDVLCSRIINNNNTKVLSVLQDVPVDAFCPQEDESKMKVAIIATTLSFICLVIISSTVLYYRHKKLILAFLYSRYPSIFRFTVSSIDEDKEYDAFISYSNHDRDCVFSLISELEDKYPFFKLCIHERDWLPGYPILCQIENSVKNSKKTILIMSEEFLKSFWFETELQMAYLQSLEDRIERIIIIIKGNLPPIDTLPLDIQTLLKTKTYLIWGERWFWEKLRYALPHYLPTNMSDSSRKMVKSVDGMINTFVLSKTEQ
ncbi:protein toll-like [Centruroides sculpturatus]|uniref:protein toll-like n=2 Tax=Centruroides sculpturatus TaxID=218467 RepID=UPI000C6D0BC5|nr:protein toll-like [Centruroides sculpturatus]XP_023212973.1 protein toll-like [Centruroides sculpturatus]XP_023212974.1 protein toll-like [Centruroides sculpturatus]XP_023212975.1 protein toll-like [Centruroides sculpturatus]XP_023212976.1 protein toll-like [Centruroides sculpturatus]